MIILHFDQCLLGNKLIAQCKERPSPNYKTIPFRYTIFRLKKNAGCKIKKEINFEEERHLVKKFSRLFKQVLIKEDETIYTSLGELRCDYCICPKVPKKHTGKHHSAPFYIERVKEHPVLCFENNIYEHEPYAEIESFFE